MLLASFPISVGMQRRKVQHRWIDEVWEPLGVTPDPGGLPLVQTVEATADRTILLYSGLQLELHRDENAGYFENWAAPEPKVFLMWRFEEDRAVPVLASVSYGEGTRMLDSGEPAGGVPMPPEVYAWLTDYLCTHYKPQPRRGRVHG